MVNNKTGFTYQNWQEITKLSKKVLFDQADYLGWDHGQPQSHDQKNFSSLIENPLVLKDEQDGFINNIEVEKLSKVHFQKSNLYIRPSYKNETYNFFDQLKANKWQGGVFFDLGSPWLLNGVRPKDIKQYFVKLKKNLPRKIVFDGANYSQFACIDDATELAIILGIITDATRYQLLTAKEIFNNLKVSVSLGTSFFSNIAKVRALRKLLSFYSSQFSIEIDNFHIIGEINQQLITTVGPWSNLLRMGVAHSSAHIAGVDQLILSQFSNDQEMLNKRAVDSDRLLENIQRILLEESNLRQIADPAAGSYYIESLTNNFCQQAWEQFQSFEVLGGFFQALKEESLIKNWENIQENKRNEIRIRKKIIVDVNDFINLESIKEKENSNSPRWIDQDYQNFLNPFSSFKLDQEIYPFRLRAQKNPDKAKIVICSLGIATENIARLTFAKNLIEASGIAVNVLEFADLSSFQKWLKQNKKCPIVVCGSKDYYQSQKLEIDAVVQADLERNWFMIGKPGELCELAYPIYQGANIIKLFEKLEVVYV